MKHTAKLFKNGHSQAVRLPREYRFEGSEVEIHKDGDRVILSPLTNRWTSMFEQLDRLQLTDDFLREREQQPEQERPGLDELFR